MSLSTLDCSDLENAISTADGDLSKLGDFLTNDLVSAESTVSNSLGQTEQELAAIDLSLKTETDSDKKAELESRKTKLEQKQKELKAAQEAINSIKTTCTSAKDDLTTKLDTLKDMKKFEDNVKDKKYDLAKSQDKALGEALKKVDKLNKQISKLKDKNHDKYDNSDDKRATKYNQLINERTQAYANITSLMTSLNAAGETTFVNSKNNSYSLQYLSQAMKINTSN
jgi:chromosome segregation ATPase